MKSILIRNVNPETMSRLKRLARAHHRSLQGELHAILERAATQAPPAQARLPLALTLVDTGHAEPFTREGAYDDQGR
jgi:plasmid stability protein